MAQAQVDHSSPRCFRGKEMARSLQCCLTLAVSEVARCYRTQVHGMLISQSLVLFQAVSGRLVKSRCEFLPDYDTLTSLINVGFLYIDDPHQGSLLHSLSPTDGSSVRELILSETASQALCYFQWAF